MKNVVIRYPIDKIFKEKKFKVPGTTKVIELHNYIVQQLTTFLDIPFFLVFQTVDNVLTFLNEDKPLNKVSTAKRIRIQLIIKSFDVEILRPGEHGHVKKYQLDLQATVADNIQQILSSEPINSKIDENNFSFCFRSKVDSSIPHLAINSMPLWFQGWSGEQLLLLQIIKADDFAEMNDDNEEIYYKNCNTAVISQLCLFDIEQWASLSCLHYIIEYYNNINNNETNQNVNKYLSLDPKKKNTNSLLAFIPESFRSEETLVHLIDRKFLNFVNHSKKQAYRDFIDICVNKGLSFCYIDRVKFLLLTKKWRMSSHRYLYLSSERIAITKELGMNLVYQEETQHITESSNNGDFIIVSFQKDEKWRIKSEKPEILVCAIESLSNLMTKKKQHQHSEGFAIVVGDGINNNSDGLTISAEFESISDGQKKQHQRRLSEKNEIETQSALFDARRIVLKHRTSSSLLEEESESLPGISKLVCPSKEEADEEYSPQNELYRNLKVLEHLKLPINLNENANSGELKMGIGIANGIGIGNKLEPPIVPDLNWILDSELVLTKSKQKNFLVLTVLVLATIGFYFLASS